MNLGMVTMNPSLIKILVTLYLCQNFVSGKRNCFSENKAIEDGGPFYNSGGWHL